MWGTAVWNSLNNVDQQQHTFSLFFLKLPHTYPSTYLRGPVVFERSCGLWEVLWSFPQTAQKPSKAPSSSCDVFCIPLPSIRSISAGIWCSHTKGTLWKSEWPPFNKHVEQVCSKICAICCTPCNNKVFLMNHMTRKHITLWWGCIVCDKCSKALMTIKLHKEVDHKNSESIQILHLFFTDGLD